MASRPKPGERVWITHDGREMEAVVVDMGDKSRVWVRSHGGHGRVLGYRAKDVRRKPKQNPRRKSTARRKSSTKRKRSANPKMLLFATKTAARQYAESHGIPKSRYTLKRMKKAR